MTTRIKQILTPQIRQVAEFYKNIYGLQDLLSASVLIFALADPKVREKAIAKVKLSPETIGPRDLDEDDNLIAFRDEIRAVLENVETRLTKLEARRPRKGTKAS